MEAKVDALVSGMQYMKGMLETIVHEGLDPSCNRRKMARTVSSTPASSGEHNSTTHKAPQPTKLPPSAMATAVYEAPAPPKNQIDRLLSNERRRTTANFDDIEGWDCTKLVKECVCQHQDPTVVRKTSIFLGKDMAPSKRSRFRKVYLELIRLAPEHKRKFLICRHLPHDARARTSFLQEIDSLVPQLTKQMIRDLWTRSATCGRGLTNQQVENKIKSQICKALALGILFEKVVLAEKKK